MKPWRAGDLVGMGEVFLPDGKSRDAYGKACRDALIDTAARHAIKLGSLQARRDFINKYPVDLRDMLMDRIKELWDVRNA